MKFSHDIQKLKLFRSALDIIGDVLADLLQQKSLSTSLPQHIRRKNDILFLELAKTKSGLPCPDDRAGRPPSIENRIIPQKPLKTVERWKEMWYHTFWIIISCAKVSDQIWKTISNAGFP